MRKQIRLRMFISRCKETAYMEKKARSGWHLARARFGCLYTFIQGEPEDTAYRMDFLQGPPGELEDYFTLCRDMGWTPVCHYHEWINASWYYLKKPRTDPAEEPELYTDTESLIRHYEDYIKFYRRIMLRLLPVLLVVFGVGSYLLYDSLATSLSGVIGGFLGGWVATLLIIRTYKKKIRALEEQQL